MTRDVGTSLRSVDLVGELRDETAYRLQGMILDAIIVGRPDDVSVDLVGVTYLGPVGVLALVSGYVAAVEFGVRYRVVHARGQVEARMRGCGVLEVLSDSDDLGALLGAVLSRTGKTA